jgi:sec-independent protein translocase protein TatA
MPIGPWELVILLIIVVVIFGAGRLSQIGGALGKSVREFRSATQDEPPVTPAAAVPTAVATPVAVTPTVTCASCGHLNPVGQKFCSDCGTTLASTEASAAPEPVTCPSCATQNPAGQAFCGQCGTSLKPTASAA